MSGPYLLIEASGFTDAVKEYFGTDEAYAEFQAELASNPDKGDVMPGVAPLRKLRWGDRRRGKGRRGGLRVVYIHLPELRVLYLLDVYGKDEADDLSRDEKKALRQEASALVAALKERKERGTL